ncbi:MAG: putative oxidoreductase [Rhodospirillales bacterium]|nr:putative oxidoreductase [Rhodospirillales bacterium]
MPQITVNGKKHKVAAAPDTPLLYVLRNELDLHGPKFGCGLGQCGACTVHLDGDQVRSCSVPVSAAAGKAVTTLEGLGGEYAKARSVAVLESHLHPLQQSFIDEQAAQCGYCTNGMIMAAAALLAKTPQPTDGDIREALADNLCRCGSHLRILRAIKSAAKHMA